MRFEPMLTPATDVLWIEVELESTKWHKKWFRDN